MKVFICVLLLFICQLISSTAYAMPCNGDVEKAKQQAATVKFDKEDMQSVYASIKDVYKTMFGDECSVEIDISGVDVTQKSTNNRVHIDMAVLTGSIYNLLTPDVMNKAFFKAHSELNAMQTGGTKKGQFKHIQIRGLPD